MVAINWIPAYEIAKDILAVIGMIALISKAFIPVIVSMAKTVKLQEEVHRDTMKSVLRALKEKGIAHEQEILAVRRQLERAEEESQESREKFELHATDQEDLGRALRTASSVTYIARTCLREILEDQYAQTVDAIVGLDNAFLKGSRETEEAFFDAFEAGRTAFLEPEELRGEIPSGGRKLMAYHAGTIYERLYRICLFADFFSAMPGVVMEAHLEDLERDTGEIIDRYWEEFGKHFPTETHEQHEGEAEGEADADT